MSDTLQIFGKTYEGVTGLVAKDSGGVDVIYTAGASAKISPAKVINPSEVQQIILPDEIIPETPDASVPAGTSGKMSGVQLCLWNFKPIGWGVVGQQYYINAEFTANDNTKVVIDGYATYTSNYCGDGHGGCYLTSITTVTGASASLIDGTEWWSGGLYEQIYINGNTDITSLGFTTSKELKVYLTPFEREDGIAQVTVNGAPLQAKTVTPSSSQQIITPDSSRIFTAPVGTKLTSKGQHNFLISNLPSSSNYSECYFKGQITISDGTIINIDGAGLYKGYFRIDSIITTTGSKTLDGAIWAGTNLTFGMNENTEGLTATVTQEFTIDTINSLYSIAAGSSYLQASSAYWTIPLTQGVDGTNYYIRGRIQCPNSPQGTVIVTFDGEVTYANSSADLTAISSVVGTTFYANPAWKNVSGVQVLTIDLNYGYSFQGVASMLEPFFIAEAPLTNNYYGLSSVTVEASTGVDITPFITRTITSYDAPAGLTAIGAYAFASCLSLASVTLPSSVTVIYPSAFHNCRSLTSIDISNVTQLNESAFSSCYNLQTVALPNLTTFYHYTFKDCYNLNLSSLPSRVRTINPQTFSHCSSLSLTSLPSELGYVGNHTFEYCTALTTLNCTGPLEFQGYTFYGSTNLTTVNFPNTVSINTYEFYNCTSLQFADIGLTSHLYGTFYNCQALTSLILRKSDSICTVQDLTVFTNTPMRGYNSQTGTVYVPSSLISTYKTATNWSTLYTAGTVNFVAIEGSPYEL